MTYICICILEVPRVMFQGDVCWSVKGQTGMKQEQAVPSRGFWAETRHIASWDPNQQLSPGFCHWLCDTSLVVRAGYTGSCSYGSETYLGEKLSLQSGYRGKALLASLLDNFSATDTDNSSEKEIQCFSERKI